MNTNIDDSIRRERDVEAYYKKHSPRECREENIEAFIESARGDLTVKSPFNWGHKNATAFDMMFHSLNNRGGVTLSTIFAYLAKASKDDDEAHDILETMADQFHWITT